MSCATSASRSQLVFADDPYLAEDAADLVRAVDRATAHLSSMSEPIRPGRYERDLTTGRASCRNLMAISLRAFRDAHAIVSLELSGRTSLRRSIETRGAIARYDEMRDVLELHGAAKVPHWRSRHDRRVVRKRTHGVRFNFTRVTSAAASASRGELYPEDILVCAAALRFRRPIKWIEDRPRTPDCGQSFARTNPPRSVPRLTRRVAFLGSKTNSSTTTGPICARMQRPCPRFDAPRCCAARPIRVPAYQRDRRHSTDKRSCRASTYRAPGRRLRVDVCARTSSGRDCRRGRTGQVEGSRRRQPILTKVQCPMKPASTPLGTEIVYDSVTMRFCSTKALKAARAGTQGQLRERR